MLQLPFERIERANETDGRQPTQAEPSKSVSPDWRTTVNVDHVGDANTENVSSRCSKRTRTYGRQASLAKYPRPNTVLNSNPEQNSSAPCPTYKAPPCTKRIAFGSLFFSLLPCSFFCGVCKSVPFRLVPVAVRRWFAEVQPTNLCMNSVSKAHYPEHVSSPSTLNIIYPEPFAFLFSPTTGYLRIYSLPVEILHTGICSDLL